MTNKAHPALSASTILALAAAFVALMLLVRYDLAFVRAVDLPVAAYVKQFQTYHVIQFFLVVTTFGGITGVVTIAAGTLFFIRRQKNNMLELVVLLSGITLSAQLIKILIERARPDTLPWLVQLTSYSFPSGHATSAVALYGFIALLARREMRNERVKRATITICILAIVFISLSRLVLNAHYFSDVIGGLLLGSFWLLLVRKLGSR